MSDNLTTAAEAMGVPSTLVQRSAQARAATSGASAEDILAAWAGGSAAPAGCGRGPGSGTVHSRHDRRSLPSRRNLRPPPSNPKQPHPNQRPPR